MTTPLNDDEIAKLYTESAGIDAPALELDNAILAAAHKAVDAKPQAVSTPAATAKPNFTQRWQLPMSIAATVVLSFSLATFMTHEKPDLVWQAAGKPAPVTPVPTAIEAAPAAVPKPVASAPTSETAAAVEASPAAKADNVVADDKLKSTLEKSAPVEKKTQAETASKVEALGKVETKPAKQIAAKPFSDLSVAPAPTDARREVETSTQSVPAEEAANDKLVKKEMEASDASAQDKATVNEAAAIKPSARSTNTEEASGAAMQNSDAPVAIVSAEPLPPETWLKNIETLRKKGELGAARKSLKAFKLHYPDYALPKDLIEFEQQ